MTSEKNDKSFIAIWTAKVSTLTFQLLRKVFTYQILIEEKLYCGKLQMLFQR